MSQPITSDPRPTVAALLSDPAVRSPLKAVLRSWVDRDPVDAAHDAGLLALAWERRADEACGRAWGRTTTGGEP